MTFPTEPVSRDSAPADPAELRRDIEEVRGELADTVNALVNKLDVKGRAQDKAQELRTQATELVLLILRRRRSRRQRRRQVRS